MAYAIPGTVASGEVATAAAWNVITNDVIDHELYVSPLRAAWVSYTPTLAQGASSNISKTVNYAKYLLVGKTIWIVIRVATTAAGTSGSPITLSLPSGVTASASDTVVGAGFYGRSGSTQYVGSTFLQTTTTMSMITVPNTTGGRIGQDPAFAVASGDGFNLSACFEVV